jgi:hypothetical protein
MNHVQRAARLLSLFTFTAAAGLSACGGSSEPGTGSPVGGGGSVALGSLPTELGKVMCEKIFACCSAAERMANPFIGSDVQMCQMTASGLLTLVLPAIQDSVNKGRAVYHPDRAGACIAKLKGLSCDQAKGISIGFNAAPECDSMIEGKVAIGGACADHGDCMGGFCEGAEGAMLGKCVATKADGMDCDEDEECSSGSCSVGGMCGQPASGGNALCE